MAAPGIGVSARSLSRLTPLLQERKSAPDGRGARFATTVAMTYGVVFKVSEYALRIGLIGL